MCSTLSRADQISQTSQIFTKASILGQVCRFQLSALRLNYVTLIGGIGNGHLWRTLEKETAEVVENVPQHAGTEPKLQPTGDSLGK